MQSGDAEIRRRSPVVLSLSILLFFTVFVCAFLLFGPHQSALIKDGEVEQGSSELTSLPTHKRSKVIASAFTSQRELSLTFNGMSDLDTMRNLLDELDRFQIKATFFLPGMRVAEEPDIAALILLRGHEIANNTLDSRDMNQLSYEEIVQDLRLSNEIFEREFGIKPKYVRTRSGDYTDDLRKAAADVGMEAVVSYTINPRVRDMQSAQEIGQYVERFIRRGSIIILHTDINPEVVGSISYIAEAAQRLKFTFVPLAKMIEQSGERKPLEQIAGFDAARINLDVGNVEYDLIENIPNDHKEIVITFDDWGSDATVDAILDTLAEFEVLATFFLVGQGVEQNPNLAKAILDAGHEIANHTYSHKIVTAISPEELQEEIVKAHHVITEAIQQQPVMFFRPPTGEIDEQSAQIIAATGYKTIVNFDVTALDWDVSNSAEMITNTILEKTTDGSIILLHLHDGINTVEALPNILKQLLERGYKFVTMTELMRHY